MKHYLHPGIQVSLRVNGLDLAEYDVDEEEQDDEEVNTVTKYVEATSGANFTVHFKAARDSAPLPPRDSVSMHIYLDGTWANSRLYKINSTRAARTHSTVPLVLGYFEREVLGVETNTRYGYNLEKFAFADLKTHDGPAKAENIKNIKDLGQVSVKCIWVREIGDAEPRGGHKNHKFAFSDGVSEKSLKGRAISQHATLTAPERRPGSIRCLDVEYPYGTAPFAVLNFRYRSRRDLQIEGVIPRSPSPIPLEERDPNELTLQESRELVRRMREREASVVRVKREGVKREKRARSTTVTDGGDDDDDDLEITDGPSKRRRTSDDSAVEIVDLTED